MTRDEFTATLELLGCRLMRTGMHFKIVRGGNALVSSVFDNGPWSIVPLSSADGFARGHPGEPAEWDAIGDEMLRGCLNLLPAFLSL